MAEIPHGVLTEKFQAAVAGRRLRSAAFLTFELDPGFFEQEVLPAFFDISLSQVPEIRLLSLADELRQVGAIAVYYDPRALIAGSQPSRLDIQRVAVSHPNGYFHPKVVLALLEDALLVGVLSANLTRSGWWENVEVAHIEEVRLDQPSSLRNDLLEAIRNLRNLTPRVERHDALDEIARFLRRVQQDPQRMRNGLVQPRLYFGRTPVVDFLRDLAGNRLLRCNLEVISPFFDDSASLGPIEQLRQAFRPADTRVFLPRTHEGAAACSEAYFSRMGEIADWCRLPDEVMQLTTDLERRLHAKVLRFFNPSDKYEALFVGSANLTNAAFSRGGNTECGLFVEVHSRRRPEWWLIPETRSVPFPRPSEEESLATGCGWRLSVQYRWDEGIASCYWDDAQPSPPIALLTRGAELASLAPLPPRAWAPCTSAQSEAIQEALRSGSFLTVRIEGEPDADILVEEDGMTHKPSLMSRVNASDILRYWSLLSPDQKKEFLEEHSDTLADPEIARWLGEVKRNTSADELFTTFAEVYLSFGNLERAVRKAIAEGRPREAVDRLFGAKFDSLATLLRRVEEESESDPVRRYIVVLCARQVLDSLAREEPLFLADHQRDKQTLRQAIDRAADMRHAFTFGDDESREAFFLWFDRWFLARATPLAEAAE